MTPDIIIPTCKSEAELAPMLCDLQGYSMGYRTIATCTKASAAVNRNIGLNQATSDIVIMCDDDIAGFYDGWIDSLIAPLSDPSIGVVSARLLNTDGAFGPMMFGGDKAAPDITAAPRVPTACIAFRREGIRFNEGFVGSGFEDDDFLAQMYRANPARRVVIQNKCRLVHLNEMKNQGGAEYEKNLAFFNSMWRTIKNNTVRVDMFYNIPRILHFVWIGPEMPEWGKANIARWRELNPDFDIQMHGEEALDQRFRRQWDLIGDRPHSLEMKSDLIRLSVLLKTGGWYWDVDFTPFMSIRAMCDAMFGNTDKNPGENTILFSDAERDIVANGAIGCRAHDDGIKAVVAIVEAQESKDPWSFGTWPAWRAVQNNPDIFHQAPLSKIIPVIGKAAVHEVMLNPVKIKEVIDAGAWAIHFEMEGSLDFIDVEKGDDDERTEA